MPACVQESERQGMGDITVLIERARGGEAAALGALFEALYPALRGIAHARLGHGWRDPLLGTTALVHECYMKFCDSQRLTPQDRAHFLSYAATVMRSIIVDAARARLADKRGGDLARVTLDSQLADQLPAPDDEILDVHEALQALAAIDARLVRIVEMRYFGGMNDAEVGAVLGVTDRTVRREWEKARLLLAAALRG